MEMFADVKKDLTDIKEQTKKTNGSVADINKWRERVNGGSIVAGIFMTVIVIPILGWALFVLVNLPTTVHQAVDDALQASNVTP